MENVWSKQAWWRALCALGAMLALVGVSGCATLSQGQCQTGDWREIGRQDGMHGLTRAQLFKHQEACAEYGVRPDAAAYDAGRTQGLRRYCTPRQGFIEGRDGRKYRGVCPAPVERTFLSQYQHGTRIHDARQALADIERDIRAKDKQLDDKDTTAAERERLRKNLRALRRDQRYQERELHRLQQMYTPRDVRGY